jgi:hypothetical protein
VSILLSFISDKFLPKLESGGGKMSTESNVEREEEGPDESNSITFKNRNNSKVEFIHKFNLNAKRQFYLKTYISRLIEFIRSLVNRRRNTRIKICRKLTSKQMQNTMKTEKTGAESSTFFYQLSAIRVKQILNNSFCK